MIRSRKQARLAILHAILIAGVALVPGVGRAADDLSACNSNDYLGPYKDLKTLDPDKVCVNVEDDVCAMMDDPSDTSSPPRKVAACAYAVGLIKASVTDYEKAVNQQCGKVSSLLGPCAKKIDDAVAMQQCKHDAEVALAKPEESIAASLEEAARRIKLAKDKLDEAKEKFNNDKSLDVPKQVCGKHAKDNTKRHDYPGVLWSPPFDGGNAPPAPLFSELGKVQGFNLKFNTAAASSITRHRTRSQGFTDDAAKMAALNDRMKTADAKNPDNPKSDVTGTDKKSASPGGGAGGGSGGGSGGKSASQSPAGALASAANGLTSGTTNASGDTSKKTGNGLHGDGNPALGASGTGLVDPSNKLVDKGSPFSAGLPGLTASGGLGLGSASSSASSSGSGSTSGGARPSSAHSSGGGGGASLGDAVAGAERRCSGKDCQALAGVTPQFASVGSLGGSSLGALDGLGSLDSNNSALDNLLKSDNKGAAAGDAMAGLDAATAGLQADANGNGESQGADIGGANGGDLFVRMHEYHQRAQKRGMVVGLTRKL